MSLLRRYGADRLNRSNNIIECYSLTANVNGPNENLVGTGHRKFTHSSVIACHSQSGSWTSQSMFRQHMKITRMHARTCNTPTANWDQTSRQNIWPPPMHLFSVGINTHIQTTTYHRQCPTPIVFTDKVHTLGTHNSNHSHCRFFITLSCNRKRHKQTETHSPS